MHYRPCLNPILRRCFKSRLTLTLDHSLHSKWSQVNLTGIQDTVHVLAHVLWAGSYHRHVCLCLPYIQVTYCIQYIYCRSSAINSVLFKKSRIFVNIWLFLSQLSCCVLRILPWSYCPYTVSVNMFFCVLSSMDKSMYFIAPFSDSYNCPCTLKL